MALVLCALTIVGPVSMDLYLPVLPALTADLGASTSAAQLTVTAFVGASLLCAVAPSITFLVAARFVVQARRPAGTSARAAACCAATAA